MPAPNSKRTASTRTPKKPKPKKLVKLGGGSVDLPSRQGMVIFLGVFARGVGVFARGAEPHIRWLPAGTFAGCQRAHSLVASGRIWVYRFGSHGETLGSSLV